MLQKFGIKAYFGDATRPDLLHAAGINDAKLLIIAIDGRDQVNAMVKYATPKIIRICMSLPAPLIATMYTNFGPWVAGIS